MESRQAPNLRAHHSHSSDASGGRDGAELPPSRGASDHNGVARDFSFYLRPRSSLRSSSELDDDVDDGSASHKLSEGFRHVAHRSMAPEPAARDQGSPTVETEEVQGNPKFKGRKSRFLSESDWQDILQRIAQGEKQIDLAREYKVSRSAISNMKLKLRKLSQANNGADNGADNGDANGRNHSHGHGHHRSGQSDSPNRNGMEHSSPEPHEYEQDDDGYGVYEVDRWSMKYLIHRILDQETQTRDFDIVVRRAMRLLLEEALGSVVTETYSITANDPRVDYRGVRPTLPPFPVALNRHGQMFLQEFQLMEDSPTQGSITVRPAVDYSRRGSNQTRHEVTLRLPTKLPDVNVFLMHSYCSSTAEELLESIDALVAEGAPTTQIIAVMIVGSDEGLRRVHQRFPRVQLLTAKILCREDDPDHTIDRLCMRMDALQWHTDEI